MDIFEKKSHAIGEFVGAVLAIDNEADAAAFAERYLEWLRERPNGKYSPEQLLKDNIGWCFGEGMSSDRIAMWNKICGASHPVFVTQRPTVEQAIEAGFKMAEAMKEDN
jgi:hypothetical protein